jgi:iron complex transport system substrate-binding protein
MEDKLVIVRKRHRLTLLLCLALAACSTAPAPDPSSEPPRRIVSLIPSATELIYEIGAGPALVGVTLNDTYPEEVRSLPKVGDQNVDLERLVSLHPDLVVLDTEFTSDNGKIERFGLAVLGLKSKRLEDIGKNLRLLGERLGRKPQGEQAAQRFEKALQDVPKVKSDSRVFVEIWGTPLMTVGSDSIPNDLLELVGLTNVYSDQVGYFQVDPEDVVSRRPEIIILSASGPTTSSAAAKLLKRAGHSPKVVIIEDGLFTKPCPRLLQGLDILTKALGNAPRP